MDNEQFDVRKYVKRERHAVVFDWLCKVLNKTPDQLAAEILTNAVVRETPAYREALGGGGSSSKSLEQLAARLR